MIISLSSRSPPRCVSNGRLAHRPLMAIFARKPHMRQLAGSIGLPVNVIGFFRLSFGVSLSRGWGAQ